MSLPLAQRLAQSSLSIGRKALSDSFTPDEPCFLAGIVLLGPLYTEIVLEWVVSLNDMWKQITTVS